MSTTKVSVTLDDVALDWLRRRAKRLHGGNLSAAIAETTELARKNDALRAWLDSEAVPRLDAAELAAITHEWAAPQPRKKARRAGSRS